MENRELLQMLAIHGDLLNGAAAEPIKGEKMSEEERKELLSFAELVQQLREAFAPVKPAPSFKRELDRTLIEMARQRMHREVRIAPLFPPREVLIGAAVGSAVALAGGVAYLVRNWIRGRSQQIGQMGM